MNAIVKITSIAISFVVLVSAILWLSINYVTGMSYNNQFTRRGELSDIAATLAAYIQKNGGIPNVNEFNEIENNLKSAYGLDKPNTDLGYWDGYQVEYGKGSDTGSNSPQEVLFQRGEEMWVKTKACYSMFTPQAKDEGLGKHRMKVCHESPKYYAVSSVYRKNLKDDNLYDQSVKEGEFKY